MSKQELFEGLAAIKGTIDIPNGEIEFTKVGRDMGGWYGEAIIYHHADGTQEKYGLQAERID